MQVQEIMSKEVEVLDPEATLYEAAQKMKDMDVGALPIYDEDNIYGILTDRDIVIRAIAEGIDPSECTVNEIMEGEPKWIFADADVEEAAQLMENEQLRRLIVVDHDHKLVGMLSLGDIAKQDDERAGEALQEVSEPGRASH